MNKLVSLINWVNGSAPAINDTNLNKMDGELNGLDDRIISLDTTKLDKSTAYELVKSITYAESTGIFTVTYLNGTTSTLDTKLEKLAVNFEYDSSAEKLVITLSDGTKQYVDMSSLITEYNFEDSTTIDFSVTSGKVKADIIDGSITGAKLQPNYLSACQTAKNGAESAASTASTNGTLSKSYAIGGTGTRSGEDTDNAKYYYEQAKAVTNVDIATTSKAGIVKPDGETITVESDGTISAEVITYGEEALTDDTSELTSGTMYCQITNGAIAKAWVGVDGVAKALSTGSSPTPSTTDVTFVVEGAKEDNITIKDADGTVVGNVIFDTDATYKEVTLTISEEGGDYTFESSVAKATDGSGANYSKVVHLPLSASALGDCALVPIMTSNTTPSGVAFSLSNNTTSDLPYKAFNGSKSRDDGMWVGGTSSNNYIGYIFTEAKKVTNAQILVLYSSAMRLKNYKIQASNDTTNGTNGTWTDIYSGVCPNGTSNATLDIEISNTTSYKAYRLYVTDTYEDGLKPCIISLQFYTKAVKIMPNNALYWYGNECVELSGGYACTQTQSGYTVKSGTKYTNYMDVRNASGGQISGINSLKSIDITPFTTAHLYAVMGNTVSLSNGTAVFWLYKDLSHAWGYDQGAFYKSYQDGVLAQRDMDISSYNYNAYVGFNTADLTTRYGQMYALWFE